MKKSGFTLVELAIVIVIIGLLVGGILQGQQLIEQARLQNIVKNITSVQASYFTFKGKYNEIPGDSTKGFLFFGQPCEDVLTDVTASPRCNGNGDKQINGDDSRRFWVHMILARIYVSNLPYLLHSSIPGGIDHSSLVTNYNNGQFHVNLPSSLNLWFGSYNLPETTGVFFLRQVPNVTMDSSVISPEGAYSIDTKIDDGKPTTGKARAMTGSDASGTCMTGTDYTLSNDKKACDMFLGILD